MRRQTPDLDCVTDPILGCIVVTETKARDKELFHQNQTKLIGVQEPGRILMLLDAALCRHLHEGSGDARRIDHKGDLGRIDSTDLPYQ
jgi:hypothetical protein